MIFDEQLALTQTSQGPVINKNMPYVAGMLRWCQELRERVGTGVEKLRRINHGLVMYVCACAMGTVYSIVIVCGLGLLHYVYRLVCSGVHVFWCQKCSY